MLELIDGSDFVKSGEVGGASLGLASSLSQKFGVGTMLLWKEQQNPVGPCDLFKCWAGAWERNPLEPAAPTEILQSREDTAVELMAQNTFPVRAIGGAVRQQEIEQSQLVRHTGVIVTRSWHVWK